MSPTPTRADWQRLGEKLTRRRVELDPRYQNRNTFSQERDIDYRLAYDIEEARRSNFRKTTLAGIAAAYAVTFDSLHDVLRGDGELAPLPAPPAPASPVPLGRPGFPGDDPDMDLDPELVGEARILFPGDELLQWVWVIPGPRKQKLETVEAIRGLRRAAGPAFHSGESSQAG